MRVEDLLILLLFYFTFLTKIEIHRPKHNNSEIY